MKASTIRIKLSSYDVRLIDQNAQNIVTSAKRVGGRVLGPIPFPTRKRRYTVLRSPHVHKESREQFEMVTHRRILDIVDPNANMMDELMKLELSAGVDVVIKQI